jgi:hypothetical protein
VVERRVHRVDTDDVDSELLEVRQVARAGGSERERVHIRVRLRVASLWHGVASREMYQYDYGERGEYAKQNEAGWTGQTKEEGGELAGATHVRQTRCCCRSERASLLVGDSLQKESSPTSVVQEPEEHEGGGKEVSSKERRRKHRRRPPTRLTFPCAKWQGAQTQLQQTRGGPTR